MLPLLERVVGHLERVRRVAEQEIVDRNVALDHDRFEAFVLGLYDRAFEAAQNNIGSSEAEWRDRAPWNFAVGYCDRLGLTGASASGVVTSPAGSMLVRLRGIDRLRWLLAIETSLATSDRDSWCDRPYRPPEARGSLGSLRIPQRAPPTHHRDLRRPLRRTPP